MAKKSRTYKGAKKPYGATGWYNESRRHSLSAKGIRTGRLSMPLPMGRTFETDEEMEQFAYESVKGGEAFVERYNPKTKKWERDTDGDGVPDSQDCDPTDPTRQDDLELKDLGQFTGTMQYHKLSPFSPIVGTDGVAYVVKNGYHWFVSDMVIAVSMKPKLKKQDFLVVKLDVHEDETADGIIEDGNNKVLYKQHYEYTTAKRDLKFYIANNVMMLTSEY